jgi:hypothetical protein
LVIPKIPCEPLFLQDLPHCDYFETSVNFTKADICMVVGEHQNFCNPFFHLFFRQHSPVPILTGFFKGHETGMPIKNQYSQLSKQVVHPVHKCPSVAIWYDEISCCFRDQSTLEPYISRTERVGTLQQAVSRSGSTNRLRQESGAIPSPKLRTSSF